MVGCSIARCLQIYTSVQIGYASDPKWLYDSDWFKIMNTMFLGIGNGVLGTMLMIIGPYKVSATDSERAG